MYTYNSPEEAISSLERAYTNEDLEAIINSKDFRAEALLVLEQTPWDSGGDELVSEAAKLLKLGMIQSLQENGFPDFSNLVSEISGLQKFRDGIFVVNEKITYPDNSTSETRIFLSFLNDIWKVALIEE